MGKNINEIRNLVAGRHGVISGLTVKEIEKLLNEIDENASPQLKSAIGKIEKDINTGKIFRQLGIIIE